MVHSNPSPHYIVLGNGVAALAAIQEIHRLQPKARIDVFSPERCMAYLPESLGHLLRTPQIEPFFYLTNTHFYEKFNAKLYTGYRLEDINFKAQKIWFRKNSIKEFSYDKLLIAPQKIPTCHHPVIAGIHNKAEYQRWESQLKQVNTVGIEGDGLEAIQWASYLREYTKAKVLFFSEKTHFLPSIFDSKISKYLARAFQEDQGEIYFNTKLSEIMSTKKKTQVKFQVNSLEENSKSELKKVDFLMNFQKWVPEFQFFENFFEDFSVNQYMETSWPEVYAAGSFVNSYGQSDINLFNIHSQQGQIAGKNMTGISTIYSPLIPYNYVKWFQLQFGWFGEYLNSDSNFDEVFEFVEEDLNTLKRLYIKKNKLVGAFMIGKEINLNLFFSLAKNEIWSTQWSQNFRDNPEKYFQSTNWIDFRKFNK